MSRYGVTVDFSTEGWVNTEVDAKNKEEARAKAREKVRNELLNPSVLGPHHTPCGVHLQVTSVEPA